MYQYQAKLKSTQEIVGEGHTIDDVLAAVKHFQRKRKTGEHTRSNELVEIFHVYTDTGEMKLVKTVSNLE